MYISVTPLPRHIALGAFLPLPLHPAPLAANVVLPIRALAALNRFRIAWAMFFLLIFFSVHFRFARRFDVLRLANFVGDRDQEREREREKLYHSEVKRLCQTFCVNHFAALNLCGLFICQQKAENILSKTSNIATTKKQITRNCAAKIK